MNAEIDKVLASEEAIFAQAVKAVVTADVPGLKELLDQRPDLVTNQARAAHRSTLLHYTAANGIENELQLSGESIYQLIQNSGPAARPALKERAVEIARILLDAGSEVDATCETYGGGNLQTTLNLLVSSGHPAGAGVQPELVRLLCKAGASADGIGNNRSPLGTALAFGYPAAAKALVECGAKIDNIVYAAAVGDMDQVRSYFDSTGRLKKDVGKCFFDWFGVSENPQTAAEQALVFASLCGEVKVVALLLDNGVDINAEPPGSHMTATPLHTVAATGQESVTRLLTERGADPTIRDKQHNSTPLEWAEQCRQAKTAELIREYLSKWNVQNNENN